MVTPLNDHEPYTCVTCEIQFTHAATFHVGLPFCCSGCVANGPCNCSYDEATRPDAVVAARLPSRSRRPETLSDRTRLPAAQLADRDCRPAWKPRAALRS
jgi:hypothetical protein